MLRTVYHVARADLLARLRDRRLFAVLAAAVYLGHAVTVGQVQLIVGGYRGVYNAAWLGAVASLAATTFALTAGFYLVKNGVGRDRGTGPGAIVAATPARSSQYLLGKWASAVAFLALVTATTTLTVTVLFVVRGTGPFDPVALFAPFLVLTLPVAALVAAAAICFESTPVLRTGLGNVLYPVVLVVLAVGGWVDPTGASFVKESVEAAIAAQHPGFAGGSYVFGMTPEQPEVFRWTGLAWEPGVVARQLAAVCVAPLVVLAGVLPFDRFDPGAGRSVPWPSVPVPSFDRWVERDAERSGEADGGDAADLRSLAPVEPSPRPVGLVVGELRLLLAGRSRWWYLGAAGLALGGPVVAATTGSDALLALAWLWPLLAWSELGVHQHEHRTASLVRTTPYAALQPVAAWLAGTVLALLLVGGFDIAFVLDGNPGRTVASLVGAAFVPAAALAAGTVAGTRRVFEVGYLVLWYLGSMNGVVPLDYAGVTGGSPWRTFGFAALATVLVAVATAARSYRAGRDR